MKTAPLPESINPARLALSEVEITGSIKVSELPRLKLLLASDSGNLFCKVASSKDQQNRIMITGSINASLEMNCQLCLKPMQVELQQQFNLLVVKNDEQAAEVIENHEPLQVQHDSVLLKDLFEDEALLALPLAPSHDTKVACQKHKDFSVEVTGKTEVETKQPFADLKNLIAQATDDKD